MKFITLLSDVGPGGAFIAFIFAVAVFYLDNRVADLNPTGSFVLRVALNVAQYLIEIVLFVGGMAIITVGTICLAQTNADFAAAYWLFGIIFAKLIGNEFSEPCWILFLMD